jgi:hypothetical protein
MFCVHNIDRNFYGFIVPRNPKDVSDNYQTVLASIFSIKVYPLFLDTNLTNTCPHKNVVLCGALIYLYIYILIYFTKILQLYV